MESQRGDRLELVVGRALEELCRLVTELRITNEEWHAALGFLTEVGKRDEFILLSDVNRVSVLVDRVTHEQEAVPGATPTNVLGPFYRRGAPLLDSPASICRPGEPGEPMVLAGEVRSVAGAPVPERSSTSGRPRRTGCTRTRTPRSPR